MAISQKVGVEYELDFAIKFKLKVYSLQLYQKLILPKMSLVPFCGSASQV